MLHSFAVTIFMLPLMLGPICWRWDRTLETIMKGNNKIIQTNNKMMMLMMMEPTTKVMPLDGDADADADAAIAIKIRWSLFNLLRDYTIIPTRPQVVAKWIGVDAHSQIMKNVWSMKSLVTHLCHIIHFKGIYQTQEFLFLFSYVQNCLATKHYRQWIKHRHLWCWVREALGYQLQVSICLIMLSSTAMSTLAVARIKLLFYHRLVRYIFVVL